MNFKLINSRQMKVAFLFIIPIVILFNINYNNKTEFAYDPNYVYLFNSLNFATQLGGIGYIDHPGTPVMMFSAFIMRAVYIFRNTNKDLSSDVLLHPQFYIEIIVWTMAVLNAIILLLLGIFIFKTTGILVYGLLFQSIPFLSKSIFPWSFQTLSPEPVLLAAVIVFVILFIWKYYFGKDLGEFRINYLKEKSFAIDKFFILLGLIIGFCLATKINTLPFLIIPFIFIKGFRNKLIFSIIVFLAFFIFTLPIVKYYPNLFYWFKSIVVHTELYGGGKSGFVDFRLLKEHFLTALNYDPLLFAIIAWSFVFLIIRMFKKKYDIHFKILLALLLVQFFDLFMVMKHFNLHYLIPIVPTLVVNIFIMFQIMKLPQFGMVSIIIFFILSAIFLNSNFSKSITSEYQELKTANDINIYSFGCKSPIYALKFGDDFSNKMNSFRLEKMYGKQYFYDIWTRQLTGWQDSLTIDSLRKSNKRIYLYALDAYLKDWPTPFKLKQVAEGQYLIKVENFDSLMTK